MTLSTRKKRYLWGFLIAPLAGPLVFIFAPFFALGFSEGTSGFLGGAIAILLFGVPISYLVALFLGAPILLIFKSKGWINFWSVSIGAGFVAIIPLVFMRIAGGHLGPNDFGMFAFIFASGLLPGILFWAIAVYKNQ